MEGEDYMQRGNELSKKKSKLFGIIILSLSMITLMSGITFANNWTNTTWSFNVSSPGEHMYTTPRAKMDTSKAFVENDSASAGILYVSIYGNTTYTGNYTDCTYNTEATLTNIPYSVQPGQSKYCSNLVYEQYAYSGSAYARLRLSGYTTGGYYGAWSPDNYNGY